MSQDLNHNRATMSDLPFGSKSQESILATNRVLRNTYMLLSMTLGFSAFTAWLSLSTGIGIGNPLIFLIAAFGSIFLVRATAKSAWGLLSVFIFAGIFGLALGPSLAYYLAMSNGPQIVMQALGGTGLIFFSLSGYALVSRKDFSYIGGFLFTGLIVALVAIIANIFLQIPALSLAISAVVIMIMSGFILYDTSQIIRGGETNYIMATVGLYLNIFNIFVHLLNILGVMNND